jgi:hypothetical protein
VVFFVGAAIFSELTMLAKSFDSLPFSVFFVFATKPATGLRLNSERGERERQQTERALSPQELYLPLPIERCKIRSPE